MYIHEIGHESEDVTHGVDTVYLRRKFSHKPVEFHFGRLLWGPWVSILYMIYIYIMVCIHIIYQHVYICRESELGKQSCLSNKITLFKL